MYEKRIYVFSSEYGTKIGVSDDPSNRAVIVASHMTLKNVDVYHQTSLTTEYAKIEKEAHKRLDAMRIDGEREWFNVSPHLATIVVEMLFDFYLEPDVNSNANKKTESIDIWSETAHLIRRINSLNKKIYRYYEGSSQEIIHSALCTAKEKLDRKMARIESKKQENQNE